MHELTQTTAPVFVGALTAFVTVVGWFATKTLERRQKRTDFRRAYTQRQIEELYGPLFSLTWNIFTANHLKHRILSDCSLSGDQIETVHTHFATTYFTPLHAQLKKILETKLHLVDGVEMPESFYEYLSHTLQEDVQRRLWTEHRVDTQRLRGTTFPPTFFPTVQRTLKMLLAEYEWSVLELKTGRSHGRHYIRKKQVEPLENA